jgi:hypothetical protein
MFSVSRFLPCKTRVVQKVIAHFSHRSQARPRSVQTPPPATSSTASLNEMIESIKSRLEDKSRLSPEEIDSLLKDVSLIAAGKMEETEDRVKALLDEMPFGKSQKQDMAAFISACIYHHQMNSRE